MAIQISSTPIKYVFTQLTAPTGIGEVEGSLWYNTTDNKLYTYDGAAWHKLETGEWKSEETTTVGSAVQSLDFTSLDLEDAGSYVITGSIVNDDATSSQMSVFLNADYTAGNYYAQMLGINGAGVTGTRVNSPIIHSGGLAQNNSNNFTMIIQKMPGETPIIHLFGSNNASGSGITLDHFMITPASATTNVTAIRIYSNQTNGIGVGSVFALYKLEK